MCNVLGFYEFLSEENSKTCWYWLEGGLEDKIQVKEEVSGIQRIGMGNHAHKLGHATLKPQRGGI